MTIVTTSDKPRALAETGRARQPPAMPGVTRRTIRPA